MRKSISLMLGVAVALSLTGPLRAADPGPPVVMTETVRVRSASDLALAGAIEPRIRTDLGFPISGRLLSRPVSVGDQVGAGAVLATLESETLSADVASAEANLRIAEAQLDNADRANAREEELVRRDVTSQAGLDAAAAALAVAQNNVDLARASLQQAEDRLDNATLKAPFAGVVLDASGEVGQVTGAGHPVVVLAKSELRDAVVDLPERMVSALAVDALAEVVLELDPTIGTPGSVREIAPSADPVTRLVRVRIALEDPAPALRLGSTIMVRFPGLSHALPTPVAAGAVMKGADGTAVWRVTDGGTVQSVPVRTGGSDAGRIAVIEGLSDGDVIVTSGADQLTDGQAVRIYGDADK